jgi:hypothetical protein
MYYTFFFNVDAVVCQNNGQFQVWELNIWQFIVIVEIKYLLNLNEYYFVILSPGLNVCTAHVLMRFCHLINRSFVCKAKEGCHVRIDNKTDAPLLLEIKY